MELMIWLGILILAIIIEVITMGLTTIWFAGGALVAAIAAALNLPIAVQIILFLVVSILLLVFTRPVALRYFNKDRVRTNAESLVGKKVLVTEEINNVTATGHIVVNGQEWSAKSVDDTVVIPKDAMAEIVAITGVKMVVKL